MDTDGIIRNILTVNRLIPLFSDHAFFDHNFSDHNFSDHNFCDQPPDSILTGSTAADAASAVPAVGNAAETDSVIKAGSQKIPASRKLEMLCGSASSGGKAVTGAENACGQLDIHPVLTEIKNNVKWEILKESEIKPAISSDSLFQNLPGCNPQIEPPFYDGLPCAIGTEPADQQPEEDAPDKSEDSEKKIKIFVRFGHDYLANGTFTGAPGVNRLSEKDVIDKYAPDLVQRLKELGYDVLTFRSDKTDLKSGGPAISDGIKLAETWGADLFISCHANSYTDPKTKVSGSGAVVLYNRKAHTLQYAKKITAAVAAALGISAKDPVYDPQKAEIRIPAMPAMILEPLFVSSRSDSEKFKNYTGKPLGHIIAETVDSCLKEWPLPEKQ